MVIPAFITSIARRVTSSYVVILLVCVLSNGLLARFYGDVCGFSLDELFDAHAWLRVLGVTASPMCSTLLQLCTATQTIVSFAWTHLYSHILIAIGTCFPAINKLVSHT